ncbi:hypothetical protein AB0D45_24115 [Streptomyces sp. NPDC048352]|uniref:hypothetical protein n=1 Tax=Streptomyces sp. NPDC048352 TaxID=3154718 RepID=UPI00342D250A
MGTGIAGLALGAVLALTGYAAFSGDDSDSAGAAKGASPSASASGAATPTETYAPPKDWTDPVRWAALPRGQNTDKFGSQVGFPHTLEGAAAMMAAANNTAIGEGKTAVDEQTRIYNSYVSVRDYSAVNAERVKQKAQETERQLAQEMGGPGQKSLPAGAYMRSVTIGFKVLKKSDDEVSAWVLSRVVRRDGETAKETSGYTRRIAVAQWVDGDWKMTADATSRALEDVQGKDEPTMAAPGDPAFNVAGWTAIRAAS